MPHHGRFRGAGNTGSITGGVGSAIGGVQVGPLGAAADVAVAAGAGIVLALRRRRTTSE